MDKTKQYLSVRLVVLTALLLLAVSLVMSVGTAYGRYTSSFDGSQAFSAQPKATVTVALGEWTVLADDETTQTLTFTVSGNDSERSTNVRVRLFVKDPPNSEEVGRGSINVTLMNENSFESCTATAHYLNVNTPMYKETPYSEGGWVYKFSDAEGNEVIWNTPVSAEGNESTLNFSVTVRSDIDPADLTLIVENTEG